MGSIDSEQMIYMQLAGLMRVESNWKSSAGVVAIAWWFDPKLVHSSWLFPAEDVCTYYLRICCEDLRIDCS